MQHKLFHPSRAFALFKYAVFAALLWNLWLFFLEDSGAAAVRLDEGADLRRWLEIYAQTIDAAAWVALLLLFELETSFLPDEALTRRTVKWLIHGLRAACALVIVNSLIGYTEKLGSYLDFAPLGGAACELLGSGWSVLEGLDEFVGLDASNCLDLGAQALRMAGEDVLAAPEVLLAAQRLALVDVINAASWVAVVVLLEVDVRLQLAGRLDGWLLTISTLLKLFTYSVLLGAALYWGYAGSFIDFWDAFLWLVAFAFIEMNLLKWQEESERVAAEPVVRVR